MKDMRWNCLTYSTHNPPSGKTKTVQVLLYWYPLQDDWCNNRQRMAVVQTLTLGHLFGIDELTADLANVLPMHFLGLCTRCFICGSYKYHGNTIPNDDKNRFSNYHSKSSVNNHHKWRLKYHDKSNSEKHDTR